MRENKGKIRENKGKSGKIKENKGKNRGKMNEGN